MVSALYILHWPDSDSEVLHSELLLQRRYQNDIPNDSKVLSNFDTLYKKLQPHERTPFLFYHGINYVYIRGDHDIILLVVASKNINAMSIVVFLKRFYEVLFNYLCQSTTVSKDKEEEKILHSKLDKDKILDNVNLIFELLDECLDFGIIQITDYNILKEFIKVEANLPKLSSSNVDDSDEEEESSHINKSKSKSTKIVKSPSTANNKDIKSTHNQAIRTDVIEEQHDATSHINSAILRTYSSAINWRPKGIFYPKNEVYIDIIEHCEFMYDLETDIIRRNDIYGTCEVKSYLSGMPVCKLGFNERNMSRIQNDEYDDEHEEQEEIPENQLKPERNEVDDDEDEEEEEEVTITEPEEEQEKSKSNVVQEKRFHIPIRDIQFHQCIELATIYRDSLVTFIPPDDKFTLMTYHVEQQRQKRKLPLIMIKPTFRIIQHSNKLQILCVLNTNFKRRLVCKDIIVKIPIDPHIFDINTDFKTESLKFKAEMGEVSYKIDSSELCWMIDNIHGKKSVRMMAELGLIGSESITMQLIEQFIQNRHTTINGEKSNGGGGGDKAVPENNDHDDTIEELDKFYGVHGQSSTVSDDIKRLSKLRYDYNEIQVNFNIPMLSYSGLKLTYLSIEEDQLKYTCFPWVRYLTKSRKRNLNNAVNTIENGKSGDINKLNNSVNEDYRFKLGKSCFQLLK
ncbi:Mu homology domain-containing protein [Scheffersomyces coipomensis]|uniref:Mu homology domain-containing protein n=1 Tax=Scheffersomyces coipomensis TaxID=1788519 RepID=UPI00315D1905